MEKWYKIISVFSLATFAVGLSEFIVIGIISNLLSEFNISLSQVGLLTSVYALGICLGAPIFTFFTRNFGSKILCIILLFSFSILNIFTISVQDFILLLILRAFSGIVHGAFFSIASAEIPNLVEKEKISIAIALMFSGLTIAMVVGVPISMYIVSLTNWTFPFILISFISLICCFLLIIFFPKIDNISSNLMIKKFNPNILSIYAITFFGFGGGFYFYIYLEPWLLKIIQMPIYNIGISFGLIGFGSLIGNVLGGIIQKKFYIKNILLIILILQIIFLILLKLVLNFYLVQLILVFWSISIFSLAPIVQTLSITYSNNLSPRISSSFNVMAFNAGIAFFSYISTLNINNYGLNKLSLGAAVFVFFALPLVLFILKPFKNQ